DGPMVLAVAIVVAWRSAHLALGDDDKVLADLQLLGSAKQVGNAGQELRNQPHLVGVVVGVAVELADGQVRRDAYPRLERSQGNLRLLREPLLGNFGGDVRGDALQGL